MSQEKVTVDTLTVKRMCGSTMCGTLAPVPSARPSRSVRMKQRPSAKPTLPSGKPRPTSGAVEQFFDILGNGV